MTSFRLPYIHRFRDRHGEIRQYFRRSGFPRASLPGRPGSAEFMAAYNAAIEGAVLPPSRYGNGTIGALWTDYCRSASYANLSASSKRTYRLVMASILDAHGHRTVSGLQRTHARQIIENIGVTKPAQANLTLSVMRLLLAFAAENGWRGDNPFQKLMKYKLGEHHSWTDEELFTFEKRWLQGTRERLVYDLLLFTAQRGGDVVTIRHADVVTGQIPITQQKTGAKLLIPVHRDLAKSIKAVPKKGIFILGDAWGRPIQRQSLTRIIRIAAKKAGLPPRCVAHGLRKAALRRLAESGASDKEIAAVSGHRSMNEVQRYTAAADQSGLARQAMKRIPHKK